jgi:hypothetical protein
MVGSTRLCLIVDAQDLNTRSLLDLWLADNGVIRDSKASAVKQWNLELVIAHDQTVTAISTRDNVIGERSFNSNEFDTDQFILQNDSIGQHDRCDHEQ